MTDQPNEQNENPLEDLAAELSETLSGQRVEISESSVGQVEGGQVHMHQSAARSVQGSALHLEESATALVRADALDVHDSSIGFAIAGEAALHDVTSAIVAARRVEAKQVRAFAIFTPELHGDAKSLLTPVTALAAGAGFALTLFVLKALFSWLATSMSRGRRRDKGD